MSAADPVTRLNAALEGRYRIERQLGEGGMATVFLARDERHKRNVALKVLKPELAAVVGAERFLAEIETTANLQHPHILPLFDSGEADGFLFYVMPYVEGESLRERLDREHQLPVNEAVQIATKVTGALQAAHDQGVVHRDIKPANILLSKGEPLVSDFGIALAVGAAGGGRLTETGLSLGTPYYMSPEQATGDLGVGPAADIYALGCVLYEMLAGDPPYTASTPQAILGQIVTGEADPVTKRRGSVPPNVDGAIARALEKVPADRFPGARAFAEALVDPGFRHGVQDLASTSRRRGQWTPVAIISTGSAVMLALVWAWSVSRPEARRPVERFMSPFREGQAPTFLGASGYALSPDGSAIVYRGQGDRAEAQLWLRRWQDLDATPIRGTEDGARPSFSPDGRELAFDEGSEIKVVSLDGGPARTLSTGTWPFWAPDGHIYFDADGVARVQATGGEPEQLTQISRQGTTIEGLHRVTSMLPGNNRALFEASLAGREGEIRWLDLDTREMRPLTRGSLAKYVPSGHVLFLVEGTLMAAALDLEAMTLGTAIPLMEDVEAYSRAANGRLVYTEGSVGAFQAGTYVPVWVDREGRENEVDPGWVLSAEGQTSSLALSPAGDRVAIALDGPDGRDLWVRELETGAMTPLTADGRDGRRASWTEDGATILYQERETRTLVTKRADGIGETRLQVADARGVFEGQYSSDGEWLVYRVDTNSRGGGNPDVYAIRPGVDSVATPLLATDAWEWAVTLSPNDRWLAYVSTVTGREEVYVRPFPDVASARYPISVGGGEEPKWSKDGTELFYRSAAGELVAVRFAESDTSLTVIDRTPLFSLEPYLANSGGYRMYDVATDGQSFLMLRTEDVAQPEGVVVVNNFFTELCARTNDC